MQLCPKAPNNQEGGSQARLHMPSCVLRQPHLLTRELGSEAGRSSRKLGRGPRILHLPETESACQRENPAMSTTEWLNDSLRQRVIGKMHQEVFKIWLIPANQTQQT
jgi:hypothetical protein